MLDFVEKLAEQHPVLWSGILFVAGVVSASIVSIHRNRIRKLEYTVAHERVGIAADDNVFGNVAITWQGNPVGNLFLTTIVLQNNTNKDFSDFKVKAIAGNTELLNQYTEISGSPYILGFSEEYAREIHVEENQLANDFQVRIYRSSREFRVPVLNRREKIIIRFLSSANDLNQGPSVWLNTLTPGLKIKFRPTMPEIHGVQVRIAVPVGLVCCSVIFLFSVYFIPNVWVVALVCLMAGLIAQTIGAYVYKLALFLLRLFD